jgi:hypothetical protein
MLTDPAPEHFDTSGIKKAQDFVDHTKENEGASIDAYTGRYAQVGTDHGWMVGGHPDSTTGKQLPGRKLKGVTEIPLHEAHAHIVKAALLGTPGDRQFVGSWDDRHGNIALDNSTQIDKMAKARKKGNERGQEGIFGLQHHRILHPVQFGDTEEYGNDMQIRRGNKLDKQRTKMSAAAKKASNG